MPEPRSLGNVAKTVLETISELLVSNQDEFFEIVISLHAEDAAAAVKALREVAGRNNIALRALTFMLANKQKEAEEVLMSAKLRREK